MDCWAKIWKDEGPRAFFKVCLWIEKKNTASGHPSFTGQLHKRAPLNWLRSGACRIRWVYRSPQGIRLAHQCQHHKRPQDKIWSCYQIKIMSPSLQHATPFSRPVWLPLSFWFDHIYYLRARNIQYWQTRVYCLVFAKKFCQIQGSVFTPNCENSIQNGINCVTWTGIE